ncbi:MAG TPA: hypothetical protein VFP84_04800 [Kofleriaceae bacterium]|nr:hypothetical protein [Kofleriaceae bacterium]
MRSALWLWPCGLLAIAACGKVNSNGGGPDGGGPGDAGGSGGPTTITFHNSIGSGQTANGAVVAYQDGDGPWQVVTGTGGTYTFPVASGRYGLMAVCERPIVAGVTPFNEVFLDYYATSDASEHVIFADCMAVAPTFKTVNVSGTVTGLLSGDTFTIATGVGLYAAAATSWSLPALSGPGHLLALRLAAGRPIGLAFNPVTYTDGESFAIDFGQAVLPADVGLTIDPSAASPFVTATYLDAAGGLWQIDHPPAGANRYRMLPADQIGDGIALVTEQSSDNQSGRMVEHAIKVPTAQTLTLPQTFQPASPPRTAATAPYPRYTVTLPQVTDPLAYRLGYSGAMTGGNGLVSWSVTYSAAWLAASGQTGASFTSELPDLSALAGWKAAYALPASNLSWNVSATTGPHRRLPNIVVPPAQLPLRQDGDVFTQASASGVLP